MCEQVFLTLRRLTVRTTTAHFPRVNVHPVLALLGETHAQRHDLVADPVGHVFTQLLLLHPVLVQRGHEVREGPCHFESNVQLLAGEDEGVLVGHGAETEEAVGFGGAPLAAGAVGQRDHHCVEVLAHDFEFADALELHGLAGQVLLRRHRVGEDVEQEGPGAGGVHSEGHQVAHDRLEKENKKYVR